jgi:tetratricopeptide (TPR) repeat protein
MSASGSIIAKPIPTSEGSVRLRPDAAERIREIAGDDPASADWLAHRGWDAYQRGDVETALAAFAQAAAQQNVRPWVLYALGLSHSALGRHTDAAASWERVRHAAPEFESVYMDLADAYIQLADLTRALAVLRDAEKRWPSNPDIHNAVGVIHVRRGALDDAMAAFSKAAAAAPTDALAYFNLGRAHEMRFARGRRYVSSQRRWTGSDEDRRKAAENYSRYLQLGGPYANEAAEALGRLEWAKP